MSSNENSLAAAFEVDADELRAQPDARTPRTPRRTRTPSAPDAARDAREHPEEVAPGIVRLGEHEYVVMEDGRFEPAENAVQVNFTITAKERYLLKELAYTERRPMVSYLREILKARGLM